MLFVLRCLSLILLLGLVAACSKAPVKTESMIRFDKAVKEQQVLIDKANSVISMQVGDDPITNIAYLAYAKEISQSAEEVFKDANIVDVKQDNLEALKERIDAYQPMLAKHAVTLLYRFTDKSDALRVKKNEIKDLPVLSSKQTSQEELIKYQRGLYNDDVIECCLDKLQRIAALLDGKSNEDVLTLQKLILNVNKDQRIISRDENMSQSYRIALQQLKMNLEKKG